MIGEAGQLAPSEGIQTVLSHNFSDEDTVTSGLSDRTLDTRIGALSHMTGPGLSMTRKATGIVVELTKLDGARGDNRVAVVILVTVARTSNR